MMASSWSPSQVKAGIEREVKQMRELDVAEERSRDEVS